MEAGQCCPGRLWTRWSGAAAQSLLLWSAEQPALLQQQTGSSLQSLTSQRWLVPEQKPSVGDSLTVLPSLRGRDLEGSQPQALVDIWQLVLMQGTGSAHRTSRDHCAVISLLTYVDWPAGDGNHAFKPLGDSVYPAHNSDAASFSYAWVFRQSAALQVNFHCEHAWLVRSSETC